MSSLTDLASQISQLSGSLKATTALINRLSTLAFHPGSEPLEGSDSVRVELAQDIHDSLKEVEETLELLTQEAEDFNSTSTSHTRRRDSSADVARLNAQLARLGEDLRTSRSKFRRAQLSAKKASDAAKQKERELVFASLQNTPAEPSTNELTNGDQRDLLFAHRPQQKKKNLTKEELEVDASTSVTAALRRTHDLLSTELSRSRFAQETFDESSAALAELGDKYTDLDTILSNSRKLLGTLFTSQKSDTWYLETAFRILIVVICWLFFRRLLLGPFVRLPLFLLNWVIWKPFLAFCWVTGIYTTTPYSSVARSSLSSTTRTPLIIQPSAGKGGIPRLNNDAMAEQQRQGGIPVGAGGANAKDGLSERIGRMAEERARQMQEGRTGAEGGKEERRADGTVLRERDEEKEPRNPKKKTFEAGVEDSKEGDRDEL